MESTKPASSSGHGDDGDGHTWAMKVKIWKDNTDLIERASMDCIWEVNAYLHSLS